MRFNFTVEADNSEEVMRQIYEKLEMAMDAVGETAASVAAGKTPVDTGVLRNSITNAVTRDGSKVSAHIGTNVKYAIYHELGTGIYATNGNGRKTPWVYKGTDGKWHRTRGVAAKHFLQFGIQSHAKDYLNTIKNYLMW